MQRCEWIQNKPDYYIQYHDTTWGFPCHDDREQFMWFILEMFSTGLSWQIILSKKAAFIEAFDGFDIDKVIHYSDEKVEELMTNKAIIRHRGKIEAAIHNAKAFKQIQESFGSFDHYIWQFSNNQTIHRTSGEGLTSSAISDALTKDLKKRGFKWIGTVTMYSYLQSIGIVNDHEMGCNCYQKILGGN